MRVVVDTNIVFSAMLNTRGQFSRIILQPRSGLNLYTTSLLYDELHRHRGKLIKLAGYTSKEFERAFELITRRIRIIQIELIPRKDFDKAVQLVADIDENDAEFVALAEHVKGRLWTSDRQLVRGLQKKNWTRCISTQELNALCIKGKRG